MAIWLCIPKTISDGPNTFKLSGLMDWDTDQTVGRLIRFLEWCAEFAEDGDLRRLSNDEIAKGAGIKPRDGKKFVAAMCSAEYLDLKPYFRVNRWWSYAGLFLRSKYKDVPDSWRLIKSYYAKPYTIPNTIRNTTLKEGSSVVVSSVVVKTKTEEENKNNRSPEASRTPSVTPSVKPGPNPEIKILIDGFFKALEAKLGEKPAGFKGGAAAAGFKRLLVHYPPEEIRARFETWFKSTDHHVVRRSFRVEDFLGYFNQLKIGPVHAKPGGYVSTRPDPEKPYVIDTPLRKVVCAYKEIIGTKRDDRAWDLGGNWEKAERYAKPLLDAFKGDWKGVIRFMDHQADELREKHLSFTIRTLWERAIPWLREQEAKSWKN